MGASAHDSPPIGGIDDLVAHFRAGEKAAGEVRVGMEHEKIGVLPDGRAPGYDVISQLLERTAARGWERTHENGRLIALSRATCGNITLEPGGQLEHSGAPWPTAVAAVRDNDKHIDELLPIAAELGISFLGIGFRPFGTLEDVPWMPKGRYRVMREYLPTRGARAHEMMKRTATVQANLDYTSEDDAMQKLRVALGLSSLVTSMFAASPIVDGRDSGFQSYRANAWLATDPDRCGLLPFAFREGARFRDYVEWALDVPMFFVWRDGEYHAYHKPFRVFLAEGWNGKRATHFDWELHLSTLFPEVRLKRYVEVRQADASSREMVCALPALWRGILYDARATQAAWALVADLSFDERLALYQSTPREGLHGRVRKKPIADLCRELVQIARTGLHHLNAPDGAALLAPLDEVLASGCTVADRISADWKRTSGDPAKMIELLRLR